jgi:hypothetical protein
MNAPKRMNWYLITFVAGTLFLFASQLITYRTNKKKDDAAAEEKRLAEKARHQEHANLLKLTLAVENRKEQLERLIAETEAAHKEGRKAPESVRHALGDDEIDEQLARTTAATPTAVRAEVEKEAQALAEKRAAISRASALDTEVKKQLLPLVDEIVRVVQRAGAKGIVKIAGEPIQTPCEGRIVFATDEKGLNGQGPRMLAHVAFADGGGFRVGITIGMVPTGPGGRVNSSRLEPDGVQLPHLFLNSATSDGVAGDATIDYHPTTGKFEVGRSGQRFAEWEGLNAKYENDGIKLAAQVAVVLIGRHEVKALLPKTELGQ